MTKKIRLWKLGNAEAGIAPSEDIIKKFTEILKEINKNGCTDIVWGPDIDINKHMFNHFMMINESIQSPPKEIHLIIGVGGLGVAGLVALWCLNLSRHIT